ncbi:MAG: dihydrofolate reductase family protein, partial [Candidatus Binatia bacterium]
AQLLCQDDPEKTLIVTSRRAPARRARALAMRGARVFRLAERNGRIPWSALLRKLASLGIQSVLIEGGAAIAAAALKEKAVDKILFFYAPKIIGGDGRPMIDGLGIKSVKRSLALQHLGVTRSGDDVMISGYL